MISLRSAFAGLVCLGSMATIATAVDTTDPVPPIKPDAPAADVKPAPIDPAVTALIDQLGDADPAVRETASKKLLDLGKAALPALKQAREADDPEVRARVNSLIRKAERRLPPAAPAREGNTHRNSVSVSMVNGERTVDIDDNGYKVRIRQGPQGIVLDVTGVEDGKPVTETYKAQDADELKKENPEAFALYDKYNNGGLGGAFTIQLGANGMQGQIQGQINVVGGNGQANIVVGRAEIQQKVAEAQIAAMEKMLEQLENNPDLPAEHKAKIAEQINRLRAKQDDVQQKLQQDMEDRRKKALDDMKVPLRDEPAKEPAKQEAEKIEAQKAELKARIDAETKAAEAAKAAERAKAEQVELEKQREADRK